MQKLFIFELAQDVCWTVSELREGGQPDVTKTCSSKKECYSMKTARKDDCTRNSESYFCIDCCEKPGI